eukprot:scaffold1139_cov174-Amphora_coffeaeformis.AAC.8
MWAKWRGGHFDLGSQKQGLGGSLGGRIRQDQGPESQQDTLDGGFFPAPTTAEHMIHEGQQTRDNSRVCRSTAGVNGVTHELRTNP